MATLMAYNVLWECYGDTMAMFSRLTLKYHILRKKYQRDKENILQYGLKK
jgi:hypothetical protein